MRRTAVCLSQGGAAVRNVKFAKHLLTLVCVCAAAACAQNNYLSEGIVTNEQDAVNSSAVSAPQDGSLSSSADVAPEARVAQAEGAQNSTRLETLFATRTHGATVADYPIGPGDVIAVSVPAIDELRDRSVQVEADGSISLPMLGTMQAGGLTEKQLRAELDEKLKKYMYNPEADAFVKEYHSRQVAVVGSVNKPGLITLTGPNQTVLDMLTQAGGLTNTAADKIILMPGGENPRLATGGIAQVSAQVSDPPMGPHQNQRKTDGARADAAPGAFQQRELSVLLRQNSHALIIALKSTALTGSGGYLNMPVRPGDVIAVPGGGNVMVIGWVQTPGYFQVGSGLTVLGAIGAAGGPMYAADTSDIHLIRTRRNGSKMVVKIDLPKIRSGEERDPPVRGNDVIDVPYSGLKIGPYVFYQVLTRMGIGGPMLPVP